MSRVAFAFIEVVKKELGWDFLASKQSKGLRKWILCWLDTFLEKIVNTSIARATGPVSLLFCAPNNWKSLHKVSFVSWI